MLIALLLAASACPPQFASTSQAPSRGWIGVELAVEEGRDAPLRVQAVSDDSPAQRAGLRAGDRLLAIDGRPLGDYDSLVEVLTEHRPGQSVQFTLRSAFEIELDARKSEGPRLGVQLALQQDSEPTLWVVREVQRGWPAARAGLRAGDRLVAIAGRTPESFDELQELMAAVPAGEALHCEVERDVAVELGRRPSEASSAQALGRPGSNRFQMESDGQEAGRLRLRALPREPAEPRMREPAPNLEQQLRSELAGLNEELRSLRNELRSLRQELAGLRER